MQERIRPGMMVFTADGERLGKVLRVDERTFVVEKGHFFHEHFQCSIHEIVEVRGDNVILTRPVTALIGDARPETPEVDMVNPDELGEHASH